jgi:cysteine-rich repeat protein
LALLLTGVSLASCTTILGDDFVIGGGAAGATPNGGGGSGAGSAMAVCGNGELETGESCDDGNTDGDDGCTADCAIEGSCASPVGLPMSNTTASQQQWTINASNGGESQVGLGACDGGPLGSGSDRIYTFTTTDVRDVSVTLSASFLGLVRLMSQPCDLDTEIPAFGEADGCSTSGPLLYRDLSPGSYFIVVDAASESEVGGFDIAVEADCPSSHLKLQEMRIGPDDQASLAHTGVPSDCSVDLDGLVMRMAATQGSPVDTQLTGVLAPGDEIVVSDQPGADIYTGTNVFFSTQNGNYTAVCRGTCGEADDVIDLVASSEAQNHPALPADTTFSPAGLFGIVSALDDNHLSYQRAATQGASPSFLASDWQIGPYLPTLFYDSFEDGNYAGWTLGNLGVLYSVSPGGTGQHGSQALYLSGDSGAYNGFSTTFSAINPTSISFRVRSSPNPIGFIGWVMIGDSNLSGNDGIVQLRFGGDDVYLTYGGQSFVVGITPNDWVRIEYNNINWQGKTVDVVIRSESGAVLSQQATKPFWHSGTSNISKIHVYNTTSGFAYFDGFTFTE